MNLEVSFSIPKFCNISGKKCLLKNEYSLVARIVLLQQPECICFEFLSLIFQASMCCKTKSAIYDRKRSLKDFYRTFQDHIYKHPGPAIARKTEYVSVVHNLLMEVALKSITVANKYTMFKR